MKYLSEVLDPHLLKKGVLNVIEAYCGSGKTTWAKGAEWSRVEYNGKTGFVRTEHLLFSAASSNPESPSVLNDNNSTEAINDSMQSEGILFRNLPWKISILTAHELLSQSDDMPNAKPSAYQEQAMRTFDYDLPSQSNSSNYYQNSGFYVSFYSPKQSSNEAYTVAGYPVDRLTMYYLYKIVDDRVVREIDDCELYQCKYIIQVINAKDAYGEIKGKLTQLYGAAEEGNDKKNVIKIGGDNRDTTNNYTWSRWQGANETGVILLWKNTIYQDTGAEKENELLLVYGKTNSRTLLERLSAAIVAEAAKAEKENAEKSANDFGGL